MFDIAPETIQTAAEAKYGKGVKTSAPYWVDHEIVRVGIYFDGISFGANFYYKKGVFK